MVFNLREKLPPPEFKPGSPGLPRKTGDPSSNSGLGGNFSLKLTTKDLPIGYPENKFSLIYSVFIVSLTILCLVIL